MQALFLFFFFLTTIFPISISIYGIYTRYSINVYQMKHVLIDDKIGLKILSVPYPNGSVNISLSMKKGIIRQVPRNASSFKTCVYAYADISKETISHPPLWTHTYANTPLMCDLIPSSLLMTIFSLIKKIPLPRCLSCSRQPAYQMMLLCK